MYQEMATKYMPLPMAVNIDAAMYFLNSRPAMSESKLSIQALHFNRDLG